MTQEEFTFFKGATTLSTIIRVRDLTNQEARTLLFGFTCERETWHVYLKHGMIHRYIYKQGLQDVRQILYTRDIVWDDFTKLIPNKRLYPEACDLEFCRLLKNRNATLPFTVFNAERPQAQFYGVCHDA